LTASEKDQVARFRSLRESIHNGPLYTILGDNVRVGKPGNKAAALFNPFEGVPKYSQRYTKKRRMIPKLDTRPYGMMLAVTSRKTFVIPCSAFIV
jgi:DNA-directed RNA polymerase III subunit RPC7